MSNKGIGVTLLAFLVLVIFAVNKVCRPRKP